MDSLDRSPLETGAARQPQSLRVLLVEDSEDDAALLMRALHKGGYEVTCERVDTLAAMNAALTWHPWDIVVADYAMPLFSGLAALALLQRAGIDVPFILVSGTIGEDAAVAAMRAGAHDYIMKDNPLRLVPAVQRELREAEVRRQRRRAQETLREQAEIWAALARVGHELIASLDTPVLLDRLCQLTAEVLHCDAAHTFLRAVGDVYVPVSSYGGTAENWEALRVLKVPVGLMAALLSALEQHEVVQMPAAQLEDVAPRTLAVHGGTKVLLCTALRRGTELIGILAASNRRTEERFSPQQERIARGIGQLASMALENARLVEELERANRIKADFVATMSHELRTPLNVIIGYHELLLEGDFGSLTPEQLDPLHRADKSARELLQLINSTLDLSRLDAGELPMELRDVSLRDLIDEIIAKSRVAWRRPGVDLVWNMPATLPQIHTDPVKLKVVCKNLVANAVKFTERGSVTVAAGVCPGGVEISVTDTGIGIAPDVLPTIFEPFRQADNSFTRKYGGVGLGLYIVRRLLDLLGGTIRVESTVGRGTTFRVIIPLQPAAATRLNAPLQAEGRQQ